MRAATVAATCLLVSGCATSASPPATARSSANRSSVIPQQELMESNATNLYQAVELLRPQWLRHRGPTTLTAAPGTTGDQIKVYVDISQFGVLESLKQLPVSGVAEMRFISAADATMKFGPNHERGAIQVVLSRP